jgi:hypothetical protein
MSYNVHAMYNAESKAMSFNFNSNNINQFKAQAAYKDGSGMGGGGMYFQQKRKRKEDQEKDIFETKEEKDGGETSYTTEYKEEDIPRDTLFNKFVNWFRPTD